MKRVLIVSASAGTGHLRAADALHDAIVTREPNWRVERLDVLSLASRWVRAAYAGGFELLASHAPRVWGELYRWSDGPTEDHARWGGVAERTLFRPFRRLLYGGGWDACVCTHFLPAQLAAGRPGMPPFSLVVTDFALHRYWAQPRVQRYFVPTTDVAVDVRERMPGACVEVTGIPVAPAFGSSQATDELRRELQLDARTPVVLVMGGGFGIGVEENVHAVLAAGHDVRVVAICGRNTSARERLGALSDSRLQVKGFVENIDRYFAVADLIVTKPGGLTVSEALASGRPLILTKGTPGHEARNRDEMLRLGAAVSADSTAELTQAVLALFNDAGKLLALASSARQCGRPEAGARIAEVLSQELHAQAAA